MAKSTLSSYENQARLSVGLAVLAALATVGLVVITGRNYEREIGQIVYGEGSKFMLIWLPAFLVAFLAGVMGLALGFMGAGQKRNTNSKLSWTGFFLNAAILTMALSVGVIFFLLKLELKATE